MANNRNHQVNLSLGGRQSNQSPQHLSLWALANSPSLSRAQPLKVSVENGFPNSFRTLEVTQVGEGRHLRLSEGNRNERGGSGSTNGHNLHPVDGGKGAWSFMLAAFLVEGLLWGFPLTFGVFQTFFEVNPPFEKNTEFLSLVGTLCIGISYLGTPLVTPITINYPAYKGRMIFLGFLTCISALIGSSFATKPWHLIITQGIFYGIGFLLIYYPMLSMLNEWWIERRGLAYGLMFGASGVCGLGLPFLAEKALNTYGFVFTLRAYAVAIFLVIGPTIPLLRPRIPRKNHEKPRIDTQAFLKPTFIIMSLSNLFQGLVFFLPSIFITSYATDMGVSTSLGTLTLAIYNVAQILGQITMGHLSDRLSPQIPMILSSFFSCLACLLLWPFANSTAPSSFPLLVAFALLYGFFAGGFSVLYSRFVTVLTNDRDTGLWLYSIFEAQRGAGNIVGGVASGYLLQSEVVKGAYGLGRYMWVVVFVGAAFAVSAAVGVPGLVVRGDQIRLGWRLGSKDGSKDSLDVEKEEGVPENDDGDILSGLDENRRLALVLGSSRVDFV